MRRVLWAAVVAAICACSAKSSGTNPGDPSVGGTTASNTDAGAPTPPPPDPKPTPPPPPAPWTEVDWPQYRASALGRSALDAALSTDDAKKFTPSWSADLGQYLVAQPVIAGDAVFITTAYSGKIVALDAATGATRWSQTLNFVIPNPCDPTKPAHTGIWAAPAVVNGRVYIPSPDGNVYALDAKTGTIVWKTQAAFVDHHEELIEASPAVSVAFGKLYLGVASTFGCDAAAGRIVALDLDTGAMQSQSLVNPGQAGSTIWSSISVDEAAGRVYATTGDSANAPLADEPYSQAFVAFDAKTLAIVDHWQNAGPSPADDSDFGSSPALFESADGKKLIAAANKDGWLYVLKRDALSAGPLWKFQLAQPGDPSDGLGSIVSPTFAHGTLFAAGGKTPDGSAPGLVVAFDPGTGAIKWKHVAPGFVLAATPSVGDVLIVASNNWNSTASTLEILDASSGATLATFAGTSATFGAPTAGRGLVLWPQFEGTLRALRIAP